MTETPTISPTEGEQPKRAHRNKSVIQLKLMQATMLAATQDTNVKASDKAACARAWKELEVLRRAIKGKPVPMAANVKADAKATTIRVPLAIMRDAKTLDEAIAEQDAKQAAS